MTISPYGNQERIFYLSRPSLSIILIVVIFAFIHGSGKEVRGIIPLIFLFANIFKKILDIITPECY